MEASHTLSHSNRQLFPHHRLGRILGQLQVVHARHDARQVIICGERRFVGFADDGQRRAQAAETYEL